MCDFPIIIIIITIIIIIIIFFYSVRALKEVAETLPVWCVSLRG
jgi:hypothetical protein